MRKPAASTPRLFVEADLAAGAPVTLTHQQAHYLGHVLRRGVGEDVGLFNGRDGEWRSEITTVSRRDMTVDPVEQTRAQQEPPDLVYCFAPLKHARLDYLAQKATEMGAGVLKPVITRRTVAERVKLDRLRSNAIEAAEQCEILYVPEVESPRPLETVLADWDRARRLVFCDEAAPAADPVATLQAIESGPLAVLVGPEGGFDPAEHALVTSQPFVIPLSLGPRVLRADTAAVAALALVQAVLGDWSGSSS